MGFAGGSAPRGHKFRKPRKGFQKQKNLQKQLLMERRELSLNNTKGLKEKKLEKLQSIKQWKIVKEFLIVLVFLFPVVIFGIHKFSSSFSRLEFHSYDYNIPNKYRTTYFNLYADDRGYCIRGYEALEEKNYEAAIYYFSEMLRYPVLKKDGQYGLLGTYLELCENSQKLCYRVDRFIEKDILGTYLYPEDKAMVEKFKVEVLSHNKKMIAYFKKIGAIENDIANR